MKVYESLKEQHLFKNDFYCHFGSFNAYLLNKSHFFFLIALTPHF